MVDGGEYIRKFTWDSVGGILHQGGTVIGTARSHDFMTREGRLRATYNLVKLGIDKLVIIGGDGSLTGADIFRQEWAGLLQELADKREIDPTIPGLHPALAIVGLAGSIDNDMAGSDMTIGADTALHRITEAIDAINSTAVSHRRTFVVEVMGRNCGYLALMSAIATGADWVLIPENPPDVENWEESMVKYLKAGRDAGRRDTFVVVAEGATDRNGNPIKSEYVRQVLQDRLGEETRVTTLGHVQRGGAPSAFDRNLGTLLGYAAVETVLSPEAQTNPQLIGMRGNRITHTPLRECLEITHELNTAIKAKNYTQAMNLRGESFTNSFRTYRTMLRALPHPPEPDQTRLRLAILHAGAPSPGMNTAIRVATRYGLDLGHVILGIRNGFDGFIRGNIEEMHWMSVHGWAPRGGAELGTNRKVPDDPDYYAIARNIEEYKIQGLLIIGGWTGYQSAFALLNERSHFPAFKIPIICLPAAIDNNLPGSELSIGADTALNNIISAVDKIKESAVAQHRVFIVEVMGRECGYLAFMSGLATGAEQVYLSEEGINLRDLQVDLEKLIDGVKHGKRLGLIIRNELAHPVYTTEFMRTLFEVQGGELFDVRQAILGHQQQGGNPSPFDRILATRLATKCIDFLIDKGLSNSMDSAFIGVHGKELVFHPLEDFLRFSDEGHQRPKEQWWLGLRPILNTLAQPGPKGSSF
jgi:6-phosphofructokinase 1